MGRRIVKNIKSSRLCTICYIILGQMTLNVKELSIDKIPLLGVIKLKKKHIFATKNPKKILKILSNWCSIVEFIKIKNT